MYAIEFETDIQDGVVRIPPEYALFKNAHVRVVVLVEESKEDPEVKALSQHSASTIPEWRDSAEDDVWT